MPTSDSKWIIPFMKEVCKEFGIALPRTTVRFSGVSYRGTTSFYRSTGLVKGIRLVFGVQHADNIDLIKQVAIHELAHVKAIRYDPKKDYYIGGHDDVFYDWFWKMAKWAKIDLAKALDSESQYKSRSSVKMAKINGIPGAFKKAREIRVARAARREAKQQPRTLGFMFVDGKWIGYKRNA